MDFSAKCPLQIDLGSMQWQRKINNSLRHFAIQIDPLAISSDTFALLYAHSRWQ
jgi:hypothetical protein